MPSYRLRVTGKVQGVYYRQSAKEEAKRLNIRGWIRNNTDGSVEAHISGEKDAADAFLSWCRKGPQYAHVTDIIIEPAEEVREDNFIILGS